MYLRMHVNMRVCQQMHMSEGVSVNLCEREVYDCEYTCECVSDTHCMWCVRRKCEYVHGCVNDRCMAICECARWGCECVSRYMCACTSVYMYVSKCAHLCLDMCVCVTQRCVLVCVCVPKWSCVQVAVPCFLEWQRGQVTDVGTLPCEKKA